MTEKVIEFPERSAVEEEAGAWLVRLDGDTPLSSRELNDLRDWLARSPVHQEEFTSLIRFYDKMNVLTELAVPLGKPERVHSIKHSLATVGQWLRPAFSKPGLAAAASILLVVAVTAGIWLRPDPLVATNGLYATAVGQQQKTTLADGSTIQLNTDSQIQVQYTDRYRNVRLLQGEAYFAVAKNAQRPFRVYAGNGRVEAVGTAFSVYLKDDDINVTVTEGRVALAALDPKVISPAPQSTEQETVIPETSYDTELGTLDAGQTTIIRIRSIADSPMAQTVTEPIETIDEEELARRLAWRRGLIIFTGDPLEEVVSEIGRYSPITVEILDPELKDIRIGGQFRVGDVDAMLEALETNFHVRIIRLRYNHVQIAAAD